MKYVALAALGLLTSCAGVARMATPQEYKDQIHAEYLNARFGAEEIAAEAEVKFMLVTTTSNKVFGDLAIDKPDH